MYVNGLAYSYVTTNRIQLDRMSEEKDTKGWKEQHSAVASAVSALIGPRMIYDIDTSSFGQERER